MTGMGEELIESSEKQLLTIPASKTSAGGKARKDRRI